MTDSARDLLAEIDATLKLGRERHLDYRERAFDLLLRFRKLVERDRGAAGNDAGSSVEGLGLQPRMLGSPEATDPGARSTAPTDPRDEARVLIEKVKYHGPCLSCDLLIAALEAALEREGQDQRCRELVQEIADSAICLSSRSPDYLDWAADITSKAREVLETKP